MLDFADGETECDVAVDDDGGSSRLAAWACTWRGHEDVPAAMMTAVAVVVSAAASAPHLLRDRIAEDLRPRLL